MSPTRPPNQPRSNASIGQVERFNAAANVERSALQLLGLERRAKQVEDLHSYLKRREAETARAGASAALEVPPEGDQPADGDAAAPDGAEGEP